MCSQFNIDGSRKLTGARSVPLTMLIAISLACSGCAVSGNSVDKISSAEELVTSSVAKKSKPEGISDTDANVIKETVATADPSPKALPLSWRNSETGSSGTIVAIEKFLGKHGQSCRGFKTTVDSFTGISFYDGEACKTTSDSWVLSWFQSRG